VWIIAGLGNPGKQYEKTRHNIGFLVADKLASRAGVFSWSKQFKAEVAKLDAGGDRCVVLKPQTFMNLSGESVQGAMAFFKASKEEIIVVHDEVDLPLGRIKLKQGGGHGGHNGIRDIAGRIGPDFFRVRVGVGRPDGEKSTSSHVLGGFSPAEQRAVDRLVEQAADAVEMIISDGLKAAQLKFHTDGAKKKNKKGKNNKPKPDAQTSPDEGEAGAQDAS
jgi:PTH1 family peptidyl-tRNA hydrolase